MRHPYDISELRRTFIKECLDKFRFLEAYGCELVGIEENDSDVEITYKNQTTGIRVSFEVRENNILVYLIRLVSGEIPAYLDAPSHWFYLDNVIKLRSPSTTLPRKAPGDWMTPEDIDYFLTAYADALREYCGDVLRGDFRVFAELRRQIDRPSSSDDEEVQPIRSNEELVEQKQRLPAQIEEYYETYLAELRSQLENPNLFEDAVPKFLKGFKRIISIGGRDGVVVAHFPIELEITFSQADTEETLVRFPSVVNAAQNAYDFIAFPDSPVSNLVEFISEGKDVDIGISSEEVLWGVEGFNSPQQTIDSTTGELIWQSPWTRLVAADLYHLKYWENTERAKREAAEDIEPYMRASAPHVVRKTSTEQVPVETEIHEYSAETADTPVSTGESQVGFGQTLDVPPELLNVGFAMAAAD